MSAALPGSLKPRSAAPLVAAVLAAGVAAAACAPASTAPALPIKQEGALQIQVVDSLYDAGRGASVALDKDGNPQVSYLLYQPVLKAGDIPPPVQAGRPHPPSVILAAQVEGIWDLAAIPAQPATGEAVGGAPEIANKDNQAVPGVNTGLAIDSEGKHHVIWSTPAGLFYADDASGDQFSAPEKVATGSTSGGSVATSRAGSPWISYYSGGRLRVAHRSGTTWTSDDVAPASAPTGSVARTTAIRIGTDDQPVVGYGDGNATTVAGHGSGIWKTDAVPGDGGFAVSLALDKDGNPHLAYYDTNGNVHHAHRIGSSAWETTDLATTSTGPDPQARWGTGIAVDDQGTHYIAFADTKSNRIVLETNQGGQFTGQSLSGSAGGATPSVAVSADGKEIALAWFDTTNQNLDVAETSSGSLTLAHPLPTLEPPPSSQPTASPTGSGAPLPCEPSGTQVKVTAPSGAVATGFQETCLAAPADTAFTLEFDNQDAGVPHNVDIYTQAPPAGTHLGGAPDASQTVIGPGSTTYDVEPLEAGVYYFQCDIHPTMNGTFVVAAAK